MRNTIENPTRLGRQGEAPRHHFAARIQNVLEPGKSTRSATPGGAPFAQGVPGWADCPVTAPFGWMIRRARRIQMPAKRIVFSKGDAAHELYLLMSGHVKVSILSKEGQEMILAILGPGEMIGEVALLERMERTVTVVTLSSCELLRISRYDFISLVEQNPESALQILSTMTERLRIATSLIEDLVFLKLPSRLAKKLLLLAESFGHQTRQGLRLECRMTQQDLANMVGTTRESINKILSAWRAKGLLTITSGCLVISHPEELHAVTS